MKNSQTNHRDTGEQGSDALDKNSAPQRNPAVESRRGFFRQAALGIGGVAAFLSTGGEADAQIDVNQADDETTQKRERMEQLKASLDDEIAAQKEEEEKAMARLHTREEERSSSQKELAAEDGGLVAGAITTINTGMDANAAFAPAIMNAAKAAMIYRDNKVRAAQASQRMLEKSLSPDTNRKSMLTEEVVDQELAKIQAFHEKWSGREIPLSVALTAVQSIATFCTHVSMERGWGSHATNILGTLASAGVITARVKFQKQKSPDQIAYGVHSPNIADTDRQPARKVRDYRHCAKALQSFEAHLRREAERLAKTIVEPATENPEVPPA